MEISEVRVRIIQDDKDRLKAVCTVTLDDVFVVRDVKVVEGAHGLFVAMPSRKLSVPCQRCRTQNNLRAKYCNECGQKLPAARIPVDDNGHEKAHRDVAHPIAASFRHTIQERVLEAYHTEGKDEKAGSVYSIADHQHLSGGPMLELFNSFRREVLSLDECVREEFLKLYVAYKAETNFVDIVPQAKRLCLSLNIDFPEIDDPRSLCKDVTSIGRWGNGNVEVGLDELEDIPYVMGLVRQTLERQLGEEEFEE